MVLGDTLGIDAAPQFITETVTVVSGGSASTYYGAWSKDLHKDGYRVISYGITLNQAAYHVYNSALGASEVLTVGVAKASGTISSLYIGANVLYMKI